MSRFADLAYNTDRFSRELSYRVHAAPGESGVFCEICGMEMREIIYPDEQEEYCGGSYTVYGGRELYCPRGC